MAMKIVRKKPVYGSTPAEIKEFYRKKDAEAKKGADTKSKAKPKPKTKFMIPEPEKPVSIFKADDYSNNKQKIIRLQEENQRLKDFIIGSIIDNKKVKK